jgi:hypothetical protein
MNGFDRFSLRDEPAGKFRLADLKARPSRRLTLQRVLTAYLADTPANNVLRERLGAAVAELDPYEAHSTWADPRLIGRNTANLLDLANWVEIEGGKLMYQSPPDEAAHLAQMEERRGTSVERIEIESRIQLAAEGGEYATHETAKIAINNAKGDLPDNSDTDVLRSRSTRLITTALLVARDGDDALLAAHLEWVREVIDIGLAEQADRRTGSNEDLRYNRPAIAALALIHLWLRGQSKGDRDRIVGIHELHLAVEGLSRGRGGTGVLRGGAGGAGASPGHRRDRLARWRRRARLARMAGRAADPARADAYPGAEPGEGQTRRRC